MGQVVEHFDTFPFDSAPRVLVRDELALLSPAVSRTAGKAWDPIPPLTIIRFDQTYHEEKFSPPRILFESTLGRIEWQQMDFRQPMYHRNLDVDELAYQIRGPRTLMTELGTVELEAGDFVRIPVGIAHDNYGRQESHILWYVPAGMLEGAASTKQSALTIPPFPGWESAMVNEIHTDCLGARHCDRAVQLSDETLLLEQANTESERLQVMSPQPTENSTEWIWLGAQHRIGITDVTNTDGRVYTRHRNADEIQYQIEGTRLLLSANGVVEMTPGTFVHIPVGVAYASVVTGASRHITTVTTGKFESSYEGATQSTQWTLEEIEAYRLKAEATVSM
jgi:uncharacterized cupin superfamily protein